MVQSPEEQMSIDESSLGQGSFSNWPLSTSVINTSRAFTIVINHSLYPTFSLKIHFYFIFLSRHFYFHQNVILQYVLFSSILCDIAYDNYGSNVFSLKPRSFSSVILIVCKKLCHLVLSSRVLSIWKMSRLDLPFTPLVYAASPFRPGSLTLDTSTKSTVSMILRFKKPMIIKF